jgi:hypothetical protein
LKNKDIFEIRKTLEEWIDVKGEISYYILKNIELCNVLINTLNNLKVLDSFDYELQKSKILKKYSNGIINNEYIINDTENFNKEMDELDYNFIKTSEILNNECNIKFYKIKKEQLPKNLSANNIKNISFMIE